MHLNNLKQNKMKQIIKMIIIGSITFTLVYLLGSFYNTTFNITKWSEESRFVISLFGGMFSLVSIISFYIFYTKNKIR
jgi:VIT1/CCC1 family predicted Fe2+/Mn2+ transporter